MQFTELVALITWGNRTDKDTRMPYACMFLFALRRAREEHWHSVLTFKLEDLSASTPLCLCSWHHTDALRTLSSCHKVPHLPVPLDLIRYNNKLVIEHQIRTACLGVLQPRFHTSPTLSSVHGFLHAGFCQGALGLMCAGAQYCVPKVGLWIGGGDCGGYWALDCGNGGTAPPTGGC